MLASTLWAAAVLLWAAYLTRDLRAPLDVAYIAGRARAMGWRAICVIGLASLAALALWALGVRLGG